MQLSQATRRQSMAIKYFLAIGISAAWLFHWQIAIAEIKHPMLLASVGGNTNDLGIAFINMEGQEVLDTIYMPYHDTAAKNHDCYQDLPDLPRNPLPAKTLVVQTEVDLEGNLSRSDFVKLAGKVRLIREKQYSASEAFEQHVLPKEGLRRFLREPADECLLEGTVAIQKVFMVKGRYQEGYTVEVTGEIEADLVEALKDVIKSSWGQRILKKLNLTAAVRGNIQRHEEAAVEMNQLARIGFVPLMISRNDLDEKIALGTRFPFKLLVSREERDGVVEYKVNESECHLADEFEIDQVLRRFYASLGQSDDKKDFIEFNSGDEVHARYAHIVNIIRIIKQECSGRTDLWENIISPQPIDGEQPDDIDEDGERHKPAA